MKFENEQRVIVPGLAQTQGVVLGATETVPGFPVYMVTWLDEKGRPRDGTVGEGDLLAANPLANIVEMMEAIHNCGKPADVAHRLKRRKVKVKAKRKR